MRAIRPKGLARFNTHGLRRLLRCVRIGLAMPPDTVHRAGDRSRGAGSDRQLTAKLAAIWNELYRRGGRQLVEKVMEDEAEDMDGPGPGEDALPGECCYPGCLLTGKGKDGLCVKHIIALARKDPEAVEAARQFHAVHDRQEVPPGDAHWRTYKEKASGFRPQASPSGQAGTAAAEKAKPTVPQREAPDLKSEALLAKSLEPSSPKETTMRRNEKVPCGKCGREFLANGISKHQANCKGPGGGMTGPACPVCGKATKSDKGLEAHLCHCECGEKLKARGGMPPAAAKPKRKYTRRATAPAASATYPTPAMAKLGHAFIRLAELLGLAEILADYPYPEGLVFVNTQTGGQALVTAAGEIEAVELTRRAKAT